jgi:hypothetical protein
MLTKYLIINSLKRLGAELKALGMEGEILLTGGAAMCLVHEARDMTKDIDALYEPKEVINRLAAKIAEEENLPPGWLNDGVKSFLTPTAPREDFMMLEGLRITSVTPEYLLAMKLMAARFGEKDSEDAKFLMRELKITTSDEAFEILTRFFPANRILPKTMYAIEEYIAEIN